MKYLIFLFLLSTSLYSASFTTNPTQIAPGAYNFGVEETVFSCYNSTNNQIVFSWSSEGALNRTPGYAIYDINSESFTTPPTPITEGGYTSGAFPDVFCCYNSTNNQIVFSWQDNTGFAPWYAIYDVNSASFTTVPTQITEGGYTSQVDYDVCCCYNSVNNQIVFSWVDTTGQKDPWYAIYDVNSASFTTVPTQITAGGYNSGAFSDVFCCYNSKNNQIVFSWADISGQQDPWYAIYDVNSASFTTVPTQIAAGGYASGALRDVFCCYNSVNNQIAFSWGDFSGTSNPYYAIYDVNSASFTTVPTRITAGGYTSGVNHTMFCCYNSVNNQIAFSWANAGVQTNPWYALYDVNNASFTTVPTQITAGGYNSGAYQKMFCCYNSTSNQIVFSWADTTSDRNPWYAIYTQPFPPQPPTEPSQLRLLKAIQFYSPLKQLKEANGSL